MTARQPNENRSEMVGGGDPSAEREHRDPVRPGGDDRDAWSPAQRTEEARHGPRTHADTRIDPDPRFDESGA